VISPEAWKDATEQVAYWRWQGMTPNEIINAVQPAAVSIYAGWETATAIIAAASQGMKDADR
jgi:hypothetical protein